MDGGYYAIKGFAFQIDQTILKILGSDNENAAVGFEKIQDVDTDGFVMQVKYKETQTYAPSKIRTPMIQLISEFQRERDNAYYLYCYFKDKDEANLSLDVASLDKILGKQKSRFPDSDKSAFTKKFQLRFAPTFQDQFHDVLKKIQECDFCNDQDEAVLYYSNIVAHITGIITSNTDPAQRKSTKAEIISLIENNKRLIFSSAFRDYQGEQLYFRRIKRMYFSYRCINDWERFFIIETNSGESLSKIKDSILKISNTFCRIQGKVVKSGAPYIYLVNFPSDKLVQLKTELISEGNILKDGHDFYHAEFSKESIKENTTNSNKICLKFVNTGDCLAELLKEDFGKTKEVYQFYVDNPVNINEDIKNIKIQIRDISDINNIL